MDKLDKDIQEAKKYSVNLYDKDNDVYINVGYAQDIKTAEIMLNTVMFLLQSEDVSIKRANGEPFDWAEIYSEEDKITVKVKYISFKNEIVEAEN